MWLSTVQLRLPSAITLYDLVQNNALQWQAMCTKIPILLLDSNWICQGLLNKAQTKTDPWKCFDYMQISYMTGTSGTFSDGLESIICSRIEIYCHLQNLQCRYYFLKCASVHNNNYCTQVFTKYELKLTEKGLCLFEYYIANYT